MFLNFLAHVFLSGDDFPLAVGNLIADQVKVKEVQNYPIQIQNGIRLHRAIDHFTDTHPLFKECVTELFPIYRHYSRVIVDMYFDHFLAVHWNSFHPLTLKDFSTLFYNRLRNSDIEFSDKLNRFIDSLITFNWFEQYRSVEGLKNIMIHMDKRTRFHSNFGKSTDELIQKYPYFENQFLKFIKPIITFSKLEASQL